MGKVRNKPSQANEDRIWQVIKKYDSKEIDLTCLFPCITSGKAKILYKTSQASFSFILLGISFHFYSQPILPRHFFSSVSDCERRGCDESGNERRNEAALRFLSHFVNFRMMEIHIFRIWQL